jgi:hypothetical protein
VSLSWAPPYIAPSPLKVLADVRWRVAKSVHCFARLFQALDGKSPSLLDQLARPARVLTNLQESVCSVELDGQGPEAMCEHVVDLSSHPVALSQVCGPAPL